MCIKNTTFTTINPNSVLEKINEKIAVKYVSESTTVTTRNQNSVVDKTDEKIAVKCVS